MDAESARDFRIRRARELFGRSMGRRNTIRLPSAYALPKAKCFQGTQWNCTREHEHERIIVSAPRDAIARHMRCIARCIRLITKAAGLFTTSVQRQSAMPQDLQARAAKLGTADYPTCAVCGLEKPKLAGCKCDATSFFTACSKDACHAVVEHLMQSLEKHGATGVLVSREEQVRDRVQKDAPFDHAKFRCVTFADVRTALVWAPTDVRPH